MGADRRKALGLWTALGLVVGNMVGAGAYLIPATLGEWGPITLFAWIVAGGGALALAASFARMGRIQPAEGGPYAYTREAFGDLPAFFVAWGYWVSAWVGNAAISIALVASLTPFFPVLESSPLHMAGTALLALWSLTALNAWGVREAALFQLAATLLKVAPLVLFATLGLAYLDQANFTPMNVSRDSAPRAIAAASVLLLWNLLGFESATVPAEDVEHADRVIPAATIWGTAVTMAIYVLSMVAVMGVLAPAELSASAAPFVDAATRIWGPVPATAVAVGAAIAAVGVLNGWVLMQGQMPLGPARDGLFPAAFGRRSERGTPVFGLLVSSSLCTVLIVSNFTRGLLGLFEFALLLATVTVIVAYAGAAAAHIALIRTRPDRWGGPDASRAVAVSGLAVLFSCFAIVWSGWQAVGWGAVLLAAGYPLYLVATGSRRAEAA